MNDSQPWLLGIESGGTRTTGIWCTLDRARVDRIDAPAGNLRLLSDLDLERHLQRFTRPTLPAAIAICMAGLRTSRDGDRIQAMARRLWPRTPCFASHDLDAPLAVAFAEDPKSAQVIVLSGTGSCCFGKTPGGATAKVGGWGHLLGDKGSGYEIGLRGLKAAVFFYDRDRVWSLLGQKILQHLQLNEPEDLVGWVHQASKSEIAALAVVVFAAGKRRDRIARDILAGASASLAHDAVTCARHLGRGRGPVQFHLAGSVLLRQPAFSEAIRRQIRQQLPGVSVRPLSTESVWGTVILAEQQYRQTAVAKTELKMKHPVPVPVEAIRGGPPTEPATVQVIREASTEQRNPRSLNLDRLPLRKAIRLMLEEERALPPALVREAAHIERVIRWIVRAFETGGRLFYAGAGTSGRLGVLDASECPPTFRVPPDQVQGIIAGGPTALWSSVEGAEDDALAGGRAVQFRGVGRRDVLVGIAASGRTPFVWGALAEARKRGARTVLLCFNPNLQLTPRERPDLVIAPAIGPELLTGSTRLKAGTATKLVLNMFTTLAMVQCGKVISNLMVDLNPSNVKLRDRALRIVCELTGVAEMEARRALECERWLVKAALRRLGRTRKLRLRRNPPAKAARGRRG